MHVKANLLKTLSRSLQLSCALWGKKGKTI